MDKPAGAGLRRVLIVPDWASAQQSRCNNYSKGYSMKHYKGLVLGLIIALWAASLILAAVLL